MSAYLPMFPQQLLTRLRKHLLKKRPQKKTHLQPRKNQRRHLYVSPTELWSSLAGSGPGKLFGKGLPGSEDLLNLMVL
jgi:hypothetical protein